MVRFSMISGKGHLQGLKSSIEWVGWADTADLKWVIADSSLVMVVGLILRSGWFHRDTRIKRRPRW